MITLVPRLRGLFYRFTCPVFFRSVGPGTKFWGRLRLARPFLNVSLGAGCIVGHDVFVQVARNGSISVGSDTSVNTGCHLVCNDRIEIGDQVAIGEYVSIRDQEHLFTPATGVRGQGYRVARVIIGNNVWIGRGVYVGPGAQIGDGSIVAANSVVRGAFPPNVLIGGAPATIRRRILPSGETAPWTPAPYPTPAT